MQVGAKIAIGAVATALLAMAGHAAGTGRSFIDHLNQRVSAVGAAAGLPGVSAAIPTDGTLNRIVVVSGDAAPEARARLNAALAIIPGVSGVRWAVDGDRPAAQTETAAGTASGTAASASAARETPATAEAAQGCQAAVVGAVNNRSIQFDVSAATLKPESNAILDAVANALKPCSGVAVEIGGHTDPSGDAASNQALSQARANAVRAALIQRGVPEARLTAQGYGSSRLIDTAYSVPAYARNRRIEFVVKPAGAQPAAPAQ